MIIKWTASNGDNITFDNASLGNYLISSVEGLSSPVANLVDTRAPFQNGYSITRGQLERREISIGMLIRATTQSLVESRRRDISKLFSALGEDGEANLGTLEITMAYGTVFTIQAVPEGATHASGIQASRVQETKIRLICPDPFFLGATQTVNIPYNTPTDCPNIGHVPCEPVIVVTGASNAPKVENVTTGRWIKSSGNVTAGYTLTFDHRFGKKLSTLTEISSGIETNWFEYLVYGWTFWTLACDSNLIKLTSDDADGDAVVTYNPKYLAIA